MYETQTESEILKRMLENVPADIDKREGSIIYDSCMPAAIEFMLLYSSIDWFMTNSFADTAEREYLVLMAKERGIAPYPASKAVCKMSVTPADVEVKTGTRFSYDDVNYSVTNNLGAGSYAITCESEGTVGNKAAGTLIPIDYVNGLQKALLVEITVPGEAEENTEDFRRRYLASFESEAYGGNIIDYKNKVNAISGVGGVKVYPVWNGGGTVKLVFMTSEHKPPTTDFVNEVQTLVDPTQNKGEGIGIAPIGHVVTVKGATAANIDIGLSISFGTGTFAEHFAEICKVIDDYFAELNAEWEYTQVVTRTANTNNGIIVRVSQIESRLLELDYVMDIGNTKLNGKGENLILGLDELAVRGELHE